MLCRKRAESLHPELKPPSPEGPRAVCEKRGFLHEIWLWWSRQNSNRTERVPDHQQITNVVGRGRCFGAVSSSCPLGIIFYIILTSPRVVSFKGKESESWRCPSLASDTLSLPALRPNKPCVQLINQVHASLTDRRWLKQCTIKNDLVRSISSRLN